MITGRLVDFELTPDASRYQPVIDFLKSKANASLEPGKYPIVGEEVFALVTKSNSRPPHEGKFEAHRKFVDFQYLVSGSEEMLVTPLVELKTQDPYDSEKDLEFFHMPESFTRLCMQPGMFAIYYPNDGHLPNCPRGAVCELHKVVVKMSLEWLRSAK